MDSLTPKQKIVLAALLSGDSINSAAKKGNVGESTVDAWLRTENFKSALREESTRIYQIGLNQIVSLISRSVATLGEILESGSDRDRLSAAKMILDNAHKWHDNDLERRIQDIENKLNIVE